MEFKTNPERYPQQNVLNPMEILGRDVKMGGLPPPPSFQKVIFQSGLGGRCLIMQIEKTFSLPAMQ
jgi:hypothetical protein